MQRELYPDDLQASQKSAATVASMGNSFGSSRRLTTMACHTGGRMPSMTRLQPVRAMAPQSMLPAPRTPAMRSPHMRTAMLAVRRMSFALL